MLSILWSFIGHSLFQQFLEVVFIPVQQVFPILREQNGKVKKLLISIFQININGLMSRIFIQNCTVKSVVVALSTACALCEKLRYCHLARLSNDTDIIHSIGPSGANGNCTHTYEITQSQTIHTITVTNNYFHSKTFLGCRFIFRLSSI